MMMSPPGIPSFFSTKSLGPVVGPGRFLLSGVKGFRQDAESVNALDNCYALGIGVNKDEAEAIKLIREAADKGNNASSMNGLAICYEDGIGTEKDEDKAIKWYRKSAEKGSADAQDSP